jgi:hypothetical protein
MIRTGLLLRAMFAGLCATGAIAPAAAGPNTPNMPSMSAPSISPSQPNLNMRGPDALRRGDTASPRDAASSPRDAASNKKKNKAQKNKSGREEVRDFGSKPINAMKPKVEDAMSTAEDAKKQLKERARAIQNKLETNTNSGAADAVRTPAGGQAGREFAGPGAGPHLANWWSRGLTREQLTAARTAANRLKPRLDSLLNDPDWANKTLNAVIPELTATGVYPVPPKRGEAGFKSDPAPAAATEADALRGEAQDAEASYQAVSASLAASAAVLACFPPVGTIIAAVLMVIAAIYELLAHVDAQAKQAEAAVAAQTRAQASESSDEKSAKLRALRSALMERVQSRRDDSLIPRN